MRYAPAGPRCSSAKLLLPLVPLLCLVTMSSPFSGGSGQSSSLLLSGGLRLPSFPGVGSRRYAPLTASSLRPSTSFTVRMPAGSTASSSGTTAAPKRKRGAVTARAAAKVAKVGRAAAAPARALDDRDMGMPLALQQEAAGFAARGRWLCSKNVQRYRKPGRLLLRTAEIPSAVLAQAHMARPSVIASLTSRVWSIRPGYIVGSSGDVCSASSQFSFESIRIDSHLALKS